MISQAVCDLCSSEGVLLTSSSSAIILLKALHARHSVGQLAVHANTYTQGFHIS
jgi:hypothetical protein